MTLTVLFICYHNNARSQIAEAFLNRIGDGRVIAESAGIHSTGRGLNPLAIAVMREKGIDISHNSSKAVVRMVEAKRIFDYVITVCDETAAEGYPHFDGKTTHLHWSFPDPAGFTGTNEEQLAQTRALRNAIEAQVRAWAGTL